MSLMDHDFRTHRYKLPPEAFAIGPDRDPDPTDLIDSETWSSLVHLPDDVAIRTSDHFGTLLKRAYDIWGWWVSIALDLQSLCDEPNEDPLSLACLMITDELQAATHAMLTGFYRQSIAALRTALEASIANIYLKETGDAALFKQWADGHEDGRLSFAKSRRSLHKRSPYSQFTMPSSELPSLMGDGGWLDFQYASLSGFSHGRPFYVNRFGDQIPAMNVELWGGSNGPVFEQRSVRLWSFFFFDVSLALLLILGLAEPRLVTLEKPQDIAYMKFLEHCVDWHPGPPQVAGAVVQHLLQIARQM